MDKSRLKANPWCTTTLLSDLSLKVLFSLNFYFSFLNITCTICTIYLSTLIGWHCGVVVVLRITVGWHCGVVVVLRINRVALWCSGSTTDYRFSNGGLISTSLCWEVVMMMLPTDGPVWEYGSWLLVGQQSHKNNSLWTFFYSPPDNFQRYTTKSLFKVNKCKIFCSFCYLFVQPPENIVSVLLRPSMNSNCMSLTGVLSPISYPSAPL